MRRPGGVFALDIFLPRAAARRGARTRSVFDIGAGRKIFDEKCEKGSATSATENERVEDTNVEKFTFVSFSDGAFLLLFFTRHRGNNG